MASLRALPLWPGGSPGAQSWGADRVPGLVLIHGVLAAVTTPACALTLPTDGEMEAEKVARTGHRSREWPGREPAGVTWRQGLWHLAGTREGFLPEGGAAEMAWGSLAHAQGAPAPDPAEVTGDGRGRSPETSCGRGGDTAGLGEPPAGRQGRGTTAQAVNTCLLQVDELQRKQHEANLAVTPLKVTRSCRQQRRPLRKACFPSEV